MGIFDFLRRDGDGLPRAIRAERARELVQDGAILVDVRENHEWKAGHAREAIHIPLARVASSAGRLDRGRPVVVVCASGSRSRQAVGQLRSRGIEATSLKGGMRAWQAAGGSLT